MIVRAAICETGGGVVMFINYVHVYVSKCSAWCIYAYTKSEYPCISALKVNITKKNYLILPAKICTYKLLS